MNHSATKGICSIIAIARGKKGNKAKDVSVTSRTTFKDLGVWL